MICTYSVENYKAYADKVEFSFFADRNIKRFSCNYISACEKGILKTVGFYGPNNTGKTCTLLSLLGLRALMLNEPHTSFVNSFADKGDVTSFEVEYYINGRFYRYAVAYNNRTKTYEEESLYLLNYDTGSSSRTTIFERSRNKLTWVGMLGQLNKGVASQLFSFSLPFMVVLAGEGNEELSRAKNDYLDFANSIVFLKMDGPVDISKTMQLMQNDPKAAKFIKEFVKNCDLHIDDFGFDDTVVSDTNIDDTLQVAMRDPAFIKESLKFYSKHNGYRVPSVFFDSVGTIKLVALSGYIYESLRKGTTLIIDEIDSSLHHILTRSIVAMFNNVLNTKSQLFFTTHDALLMDLRNLLRKDQVWLIDISDDQRSSKAIRMSKQFSARSENGIRGDEDVTQYYLKGHFGSIPTPDLFASLEEATSDD